LKTNQLRYWSFYNVGERQVHNPISI